MVRMAFLRRCPLIFFMCALALGSSPALAGPWDFNSQAELTKDKIEAFLSRAVIHFDTASFAGFNQAEWLRTRQFLLRHRGQVHPRRGAELGPIVPRPQLLGPMQGPVRRSARHAGPEGRDRRGFHRRAHRLQCGHHADPRLAVERDGSQGRPPTECPRPTTTTGGTTSITRTSSSRMAAHQPLGARPERAGHHPDRDETVLPLPAQGVHRRRLRVHLVRRDRLSGATDSNNNAFNELCQYARHYAAQHGRRHAILFTSHSAGRRHDGVQLLDYAAFPTRMRYTNTYPHGMEINTTLPDASVRDLIGILENVATCRCFSRSTTTPARGPRRSAPAATTRSPALPPSRRRTGGRSSSSTTTKSGSGRTSGATGGRTWPCPAGGTSAQPPAWATATATR